MGKAAIRAAEAAEYENAGTIEFLVDAKGNFYFIEMNTRIQVEHPVTEEVTGIDLIKQQIRIANGEKLEFDQGDIKFEKHAIECRINAEDPARNFAPSPGHDRPLLRARRPRRPVDSHVYSGYVIPPYYDSMIGKLICFGSTRKEALERAYRALSEYLIRGIKTTIPLHKAIMADPLFIEGKATTAYMEEFLSRASTRASPRTCRAASLFGLKVPTGSYTNNDAYDDVDRDSQIGSGSTDILLGGYQRFSLGLRSRLERVLAGPARCARPDAGAVPARDGTRRLRRRLLRRDQGWPPDDRADRAAQVLLPQRRTRGPTHPTRSRRASSACSPPRGSSSTCTPSRCTRTWSCPSTTTSPATSWWRSLFRVNVSYMF
jgi:hypothetical protein